MISPTSAAVNRGANRSAGAVITVALAAASLMVPFAADTARASTMGQQITATTAVKVPTLTIKGFAFSALSVKRGTKFIVRNMDNTDHTIKIAGTKLDPLVKAGKSVTLTAPSKAGSYKLSCDFHLTMHGVLKVTN